jgi:glycosyltransferase involved in cell wall biosynthesis
VIGAPLLTVAVPTYRRVDLLRRCLESVRPRDDATRAEIELIISDNSPDAQVEDHVAAFRSSWPGVLHYDRNPSGTGAVNNFNLCVRRANGQYTLILHDDDYLLPGAIDRIVGVLRDAAEQRDRVLLFGVRVEDLSGRVYRRQTFARDVTLTPRAAFERLLVDSSFVRVPGLVVETAAYRETGGFRVEAGTTCDVDMSVQLFGRFGVRCVPITTAVYTVHPGGVTTTVFTPKTIHLLLDDFERAKAFGILDAATMQSLLRRWFHHFILAGTWRALRRRDRTAARQVYALFAMPEIRRLGVSARWLPVRLAFAVLSGAPVTPALGGADHGATTTAGTDADHGAAGADTAETTREW